ncbi:restriction endonuclease subunit S [Hymenobacter convexus]|uniref:restriction endonuclease subunit S n=1 Tax=Hymenobacter sp. CA1UV-4 TaxID=3063782 RepID=UPI0027125A6A|nr:restriction endonuclease subunit S [Hymenobacter sp. CA1UV-4]MDO7853424.1 restriction endonuclease subunit S [Hymenobacter sp. CA1UV-4]
MNKYTHYKPSGLEWIKQVPEHWGIMPLFACLSERYQKNIGGKFDKVFSLSYGRIVDRHVESNFGLLPESFDTYQIVSKGNIIIRPTDLQNDKRSLRVGLVRSEEPGIITSAYIALEAVRNDSSCLFFYYLLHSYDLSKVLYGLGGGVRQSLKYSDLKRLLLPVPSTSEQHKIADFLEEVIPRINALIAQKKKMLGLLQEELAVTINQSVTKGLDLDAPMKESGIEWLGKIPSHWEIVKLTTYLESIVDYRGRTPNKISAGVFLVTARNVKNGIIDYSLSEEFVSIEEAELFMKRGDVEIGDVLFTMEAPLGEAANVDRIDICLAQRLVKFRGQPDKLNNYFLKEWIRSHGFQNHLQSYATGSTALGIKASKLNQLIMVVPPLAEQARIVDSLTSCSERTNRAVTTINKEIIFLQEYRDALVVEAVTGQIDVRQYEPNFALTAELVG